MEILETGHAYLTAYEVLKIVKSREKAARFPLGRPESSGGRRERPTNPYDDARDRDLLGGHDRVQQAREQLVPSLLVHCPPGTRQDGDDAVGESISQFCTDLQKLSPDLTVFQIRNLLSVLPRNDSELACIFPTPEAWGTIAAHSEGILTLVNKCFPASAFD
jgi:hypothetical protein